MKGHVPVWETPDINRLVYKLLHVRMTTVALDALKKGLRYFWLALKELGNIAVTVKKNARDVVFAVITAALLQEFVQILVSERAHGPADIHDVVQIHVPTTVELGAEFRGYGQEI